MNEVVGFAFAWALRSAVVALLGALLVMALRRRSAALRNCVWRGTVAGMIVIPLFLSVGPKLSRTVTTSPNVTKAMSEARTVTSTLTTLRIVKIDANLYQADGSESPLDAGTMLSLAYLLGVALLFRRWFRSLSTARLMARLGDPMLTSLSLSYLDSSAPAVRVVKSPSLKVPITFGWRNPMILLPAESLEWPSSRREAALLHERAHIARADWVWLCLSQWLTALQWFNPAVWLAQEALRSTAEDAADDRVLASGLSSSDYASELLSVAEASSGHLLTGVAMARKQGIHARLKRVLASNNDRSLPGPKLAGAIISMLVLGGVVLSACEVGLAAGVKRLRMSGVGATSGPRVVQGEVQKLSNGSRVSIAFIASNQGTRSWSKDGTVKSRAEYDWMVKNMGSGGESTLWLGQTSPTKRTVLIVVKVANAQTDNVSFAGRFGGANVGPRFSFGPLGEDPSHTSFGWFPFTVTPGQPTGDFAVRLGTGPFHEVASGEIGYGPLAAVAHDPIRSTQYLQDPVTKKLRAEYHYDHSHTAATVDVRIPDEYLNKDVKIQAYDATGHPLEQAGSSGPDDSDVQHHARADFRVNDPKKIVRVSLAVRDVEWVTFHQVHLYPVTQP